MYIIQEISILALGKIIISWMERIYSSKREIALKEKLKMVNKAMGHIIMQTVIFIKEIGSMTTSKDKEKCFILMEIVMMVIGAKEKEMAKELISSIMELFIEEALQMERKMVLVLLILQMELKLKQTGQSIILKEKERYFTKMETILREYLIFL